MITIQDKHFELYMRSDEIQAVVRRLAKEISADLRHLNPIVCPVLNGSFFFGNDLLRNLDFDPELQCVRYSSYSGIHSTGEVNRLLAFPDSVRGRHVLVVEDIIETGISMKAMLADLQSKSPAAIHVCTLMRKPALLQCEVQIDYVGKDIPDDFIVGYGFDYNGHGRTYPDIYSLV
ncbi:MAG: hypoxanthine phosphoribosyltransferase [Bacteroidales bacterium]|nr:hypoxanthine phosphoribosyltransferase [Bacteroidales bacterium]